MSNNILSTLDFENHPIQTIIENGEVWFRASDLGNALHYGNIRQALQDHVEECDVRKLDTTSPCDITNSDTPSTARKTQTVNFVNESGMYALIFGSKKPEAKRFKKWVTAEVLPQIRKTGSYINQNSANLDLTQAQQQIAELSKRLQQMESLFCVREWGSVHPVAVEQDHEKQAVLDHRKNWRIIYDYVLQGLNSIEIGIKLDLDASGIRRHIREMRKCGILPPDPRQQALDLQKRLEQRHQTVLQHFANGGN